MSVGDRFWAGLDQALAGRRSGFGPGFAMGVLLTLTVLLALHEVTR